MRTVTWWLLLGWFAVGVILGSGMAMFMLRDGREPPPFPVVAAAVPVVVLLILLWWGWQIRRYTAGKPSRLSAVAANRVAALALACSYSGVLLTGLFTLMAMLYWLSGSTEYIRGQVLSVGLTALASLGLAIGGLVVERWCRVDENDDELRGAPAQP